MNKIATIVLVTATATLLSACASGNAVTAGEAGVVKADFETVGKAPMIPAGPGKITIRLSGEAYDGGPDFAIFMDGAKVGAGTVDWALDTAKRGFAVNYDDNRVIPFALGSSFRSNGNLRWKDLSFDVDMPKGGPKVISVYFGNDKYKEIKTKKLDRNLIVDWVAVNGHRIQAEAAGVVFEPVNGFSRPGTEKILRNGALVFDVQELLGIAPKATDSVAQK